VVGVSDSPEGQGAAAAEKLKAFLLIDPMRSVNIKELIEERRV